MKIINFYENNNNNEMIKKIKNHYNKIYNRLIIKNNIIKLM